MSGPRCLVVVLDGVGVGAAPDAAAYGDAGADTLGRIDASGLLRMPTLHRLGLGRILGDAEAPAAALWGRMTPRAAGKDSTTGHWELAGAVLEEPFRTFDRFPDALVAAIERDAGIRFIGNVPASGTAIIEELGAEHLRSGRPILYTSADSVLQIAAHVEAFPAARLDEICTIARRHADRFRVGRVIARPFAGPLGAFARTDGRHDYAMAPPATVLDRLSDVGVPVIGIGKTADLFAGRGFTATHPTRSNDDGMRRTDAVWQETERGLLFLNLVDFDTLFGHRRDVHGFAGALAAFDQWFAGLLPTLRPDDLILITADHGNDPGFRGTDHTREQVPLLAVNQGRQGPLGVRDGFADVAATLPPWFGLEPWPVGEPLLRPTAPP